MLNCDDFLKVCSYFSLAFALNLSDKLQAFLLLFCNFVLYLVVLNRCGHCGVYICAADARWVELSSKLNSVFWLDTTVLSCGTEQYIRLAAGCWCRLLDKLLVTCPNTDYCHDVLPRQDLHAHLIFRSVTSHSTQPSQQRFLAGRVSSRKRKATAWCLSVCLLCLFPTLVRV